MRWAHGGVYAAVVLHLHSLQACRHSGGPLALHFRTIKRADQAAVKSAASREHRLSWARRSGGWNRRLHWSRLACAAAARWNTNAGSSQTSNARRRDSRRNDYDWLKLTSDAARQAPLGSCTPRERDATFRNLGRAVTGLAYAALFLRSAPLLLSRPNSRSMLLLRVRLLCTKAESQPEHCGTASGRTQLQAITLGGSDSLASSALFTFLKPGGSAGSTVCGKLWDAS
jgi:hypothetical protein